MADDDVNADRLAIPSLVAQHIYKTRPSSTTPSLAQADIAAAISEVTIETQILGASFLTVTMADPDWALQRSGLFTVDDGLLSPLEVQFPENTNSWWRLCMVEATSDLSQPNLTLTFEDRIISLLRDHWGHKTAPPGSMSRAEFIRSLVNEVKTDGGIRFVCRALAAGLPVATTPLGAPAGSTKPTAPYGKGLSPRASITIKGQRPTTQQVEDLNTALNVAERLSAGPIATQALICAGIGESNFQRRPQPPNPNYVGIWQGSPQNGWSPDDVQDMAQAFLQGGRGYQGGGGIALSRTVSDPGEIAWKVEGDRSNFSSDAQATNFYGQWLPEAQAIIAAYGGASTGSQSPASSKSQAVDALDSSSSPASDPAQLSRGTPDNPDEDSWDCISRLAQDVNWRAYSDADSLYYLNDEEIVAQMPAVYIQPGLSAGEWAVKPNNKKDQYGTVASIQYTFDNTALIYQSTRTRHGRKQRRSRISKPQSPSQVILNLVCGIDEYRAGQVFLFDDAGPLSGRWIVQDATRNCLQDTFTQFTLGPPQAPTPESQATGAPRSSTSSPSTGGAQTVPAGSAPSGTTVPNTSWNPDRKPICKWIVPILTWAASHGWSGSVTSGYRTAAEQQQAAANYAAQKGVPISSIYPDGPLASNHCKSSYPGGAVDVSIDSASQLAGVLVNYPHTPNLVWGGPTIEDSVHFSATGH